MNPINYSLLFDWASVLAPDDCLKAAKYLSKKYQYDYVDLKKMLGNEYDFSISKKYEGYIKMIQKKYHIPKKDIIYSKNSTLPNKTFDFCHNLKKNGYHLYLLSDQMQFRTDFIKNNFDLSCFKQTFFSSEIGYTKQNKEAFLYVIKKTKINPHKTIFIDDFQENINMAKSVGIKGVLYTSLVILKKELNSYGIKIRE